MSKRTKAKRRRSKENRNSSRPPSTSSAHDANHSNTPMLASLKKAMPHLLRRIKEHKFTSSILGVFVFAAGGILNYFGNDARILYFPAGILCIFICWGIIHGTHLYVRSKTEGSGRVTEATLSHPTTNAPNIWPTHISLYDGKWFKTTPVTIGNPNPFPLYFVTVLVTISGSGVTVDSILTPEGIGRSPGMPMTPYGISGQSPNGKRWIQLILDMIPANGTRTLRFKGTIPIESSADLSIGDFRTTGEVEFFPGDVVDGFPSTNQSNAK